MFKHLRVSHYMSKIIHHLFESYDGYGLTFFSLNFIYYAFMDLSSSVYRYLSQELLFLVVSLVNVHVSTSSKSANELALFACIEWDTKNKNYPLRDSINTEIAPESESCYFLKEQGFSWREHGLKVRSIHYFRLLSIFLK